MSKLEFIYFPIHGRAFMARSLIELAGIDCKDTILSFEEFGKIKSELPLGQVPVLKVDGEMYCQTQAINAYLAKISNFPELSDLEALKCQMIIETTNEMFDGIFKPAFHARG